MRKNLPRSIRVLGSQSLKRCAKKRCPGRTDRRSIGGVRLDENIQVFCCPRFSMEGDGIAADHQVFNLVIVEAGQEFFEVWVH